MACFLIRWASSSKLKLRVFCELCGWWFNGSSKGGPCGLVNTEACQPRTQLARMHMEGIGRYDLAGLWYFFIFATCEFRRMLSFSLLLLALLLPPPHLIFPSELFSTASYVHGLPEQSPNYSSGCIRLKPPLRFAEHIPQRNPVGLRNHLFARTPSKKASSVRFRKKKKKKKRTHQSTAGFVGMEKSPPKTTKENQKKL
ncbi:hypothetical protein BX600DRAFT_308139 [Xylariales sp. PMI_506]|nr:hypothetical protein BX600DRAFT_308139 [Xylariales sp. PMI_506]